MLHYVIKIYHIRNMQIELYNCTNCSFYYICNTATFYYTVFIIPVTITLLT